MILAEYDFILAFRALGFRAPRVIRWKPCERSGRNALYRVVLAFRASGFGVSGCFGLWGGSKFLGLGFTLRVQVPNKSYTLLNIELHNYYPKSEYLIIGSFGLLGFRG